MDEERVKIYSYAKVWKYEKKIYSIMNWHLPTPVNPYDLATFVGVLLAEMFAMRVFPFLAGIPFVLKYIMIPYMGTYVLRRKKLDGKNPVAYFMGVIWYTISIKGTYVEGWKRVRETPQTIKLAWYYSRGKEVER